MAHLPPPFIFHPSRRAWVCISALKSEKPGVSVRRSFLHCFGAIFAHFPRCTAFSKAGWYADTALPDSGKAPVFGRKKAPISIAENRCSPLCYSVVTTYTGAGAARPSPPWVYPLPAERCAIPPAHGQEAADLTARMSIYSFGRFGDGNYFVIPNSHKHSFKSLWCSFIRSVVSCE